MGLRTSHLRFVAALVLALLPAASARAIIIYGDPGWNTTMPLLPAGVKPGWQYIGNSSGFAGIPIGPRAWVTASHVTGPSSTGFWYDNAGTTGFIEYFGTRSVMSGDLAVMVLDPGQPSFQQWAPVWSRTDNLPVGQGVYMYGYGLTRGGTATNNVPVPDSPKGWYWGGYTFALSYGTNGIDSLATDVSGNIYFAMAFDQPTEQNGLPGTEGIYTRFDSGGGVFSYNPSTSRWELLGINSSVETVSATLGGAPLGAALYDTRGFFDDDGEITGAAPKPLSSYATALPFKYDVIAPFTVVPEPSASVLAGMATALLILHRRMAAKRR